MKTKKTKLIFTIIILLIWTILLIKAGGFRNLSAENLRDYIKSFGSLAPVVYIVLFAIVPLTLFPDSILAIASGMCFGLFSGTVYTIIGAVCGSTISFLLARYLLGEYVNNLIKDKSIFKIYNNGFLVIFLLRLIPLVPFDVISYGAGAASIKYKDFLFATMLGIIPGVIIFTNIGDKSLNIHSAGFVVSIILLVLLVLATYILKKKLFLKKNENI